MPWQGSLCSQKVRLEEGRRPREKLDITLPVNVVRGDERKPVLYVFEAVVEEIHDGET